jgi:protein arginine kinase activator
MDYKQFKKVGRLGCSTCYSEFESDLGPLLKKIHGADEHRGKNWILMKGSNKSSSKITLIDLSEQLQKAVEKEDFEKAAEIRDLIRSRNGNADDGEEK